MNPRRRHWHHNPFHRHLYWQIHVAFVCIALAGVALAMTASRLVAPPQVVPRPLGPIAEHLAESIDAADPGPSLDRLADALQLRLELWDSQLGVLGLSDLPFRPPDPAGEDIQWLAFHDGPAVAVHLRDGRWLGMGYRWEWDHRRFVVGLVVLAGVVSLLVYPLARRITRRLERLGAVVDRWGDGDLDARARVHGMDEVARLGAVFNSAADRVQALLEGQRRMLASASHELRSPLARVRMALELLDDGSPERAGIVGGAARDIEELDELVADLLLTSRLQGRPEPGPREAVDLGSLTSEEAARVGASAVGSATAWGDPRMLRRAVRNLLENARRHGACDAVEVRVASADGWVTVEVLDRGPGVPEAERPRIFEPFYRAAGHAEGRDGGVGLGLALVREIAVHHGGDCDYLPRDGGGSVFRLRVPTR